MNLFYSIDEEIGMNQFGMKAYWINWLYKNGYNIPKTVLISKTNKKIAYENRNKFIKMIEDNFKILSKHNKKYKLAIRSSSIYEDGFYNSKAGEFDSILGVMSKEEAFENYIKVLESGINYGIENMGVIVQEFIESEISGVVFSSNPINFSKNEMIISAVLGKGDKLVSGKINGEDLLINKKNKRKSIMSSDFFKKYIEEINLLLKLIEEMEKSLKFPVDIEWALNEKREMYIIQIRPISTMVLEKPLIEEVKNDNLININPKLLNNDKIKIRLEAEDMGIDVSKAYIIVANYTMMSKINIKNIKRSKNCVGYSVVLIYPDKIENKIVRAFVGNKDKVDRLKVEKEFLKKESEFENLEECIINFFKKVKDDYWLSTIIIQEIYDAEYTGIIKKIGDKYIIEYTEGHFASKGIVPMSMYIVKNFNLIRKKEVFQEKSLRILEGFVFEEKVNRKIIIDEKIIFETIKKLSNFFKSGKIIEFGIVEKPYLIDVFHEKDENLIKNIEAGIIFKGKIKGRLVYIKPDEMKAIDSHFKNILNKNKQIEENIVFYSKLPDISFMKYINKLNKKNISFIFKEGSILCHLAILLRENHIPSILGYDIDKLVENDHIEIEI